MITSILIDQNQSLFIDEFKETINSVCPNVNLIGHCNTMDSGCQLVANRNPDLVFLSVGQSISFKDTLFRRFDAVSFEIIFISHTYESAIEALRCCAIGFLIYPIEIGELLSSIQRVQTKIEQKRERVKERKLSEKFLRQFSDEEVIGIPTMEGFEFLKICEIVRCEGLQKCTRVVTKNNGTIVSSYNLGEFKKTLAPYGFYSPHKSYLINLKQICKYYKEGTIKMSDGKNIPVAKRKKSEFVNQVKHI